MRERCRTCYSMFIGDECPRCGTPSQRASKAPSGPTDRVSASPGTTVVSGVPDTVSTESATEAEVDDLIASASRPSLAELVTQGVKRGLIVAGNGYFSKRKRP